MSRYCGICDHYYPAGHYHQHIMSAAHQAEIKHRRAMQKWYRANGS